MEGLGLLADCGCVLVDGTHADSTLGRGEHTGEGCKSNARVRVVLQPLVSRGLFV